MFAIDDCLTGRPYAYSDLCTNDGIFMAGHGDAEHALDAKGREEMSRFGIRPTPRRREPRASHGCWSSTACRTNPLCRLVRRCLRENPAGWRFKSRNHRTDCSILYDTRVPGWDKEPGFL